MLEFIIPLISGAIGGNVAGGLLKNFSQGGLLNSIIGIVGGGLGGSVLGMLGGGDIAAQAGSMDLSGILSSVATGGAGGAVLLPIISFIRKAIGK